MRPATRCLLAISALGCLAFLAIAADEKKPPIITASPSVFDSGNCNPLHSAISRDGKFVAYVPSPKGLIEWKLHLCDFATKKVLHRLDTWVQGVAFTPDSTRLLCDSTRKDRKDGDGSLYQFEVYDVKTGKRLRTIRLKTGQPWGGGGYEGSPRCAHNDDIVVVAGKNEFATVYDLKTGKALGDLPSNNRAFFLALSRDGRWLVTADQKNGVVHTWDVKARKHDRKLYEHIGLVESVAISPDGRWCACGTSRGIKVFDRTTGGEKTEGRTGLAGAGTIEFSPNGKRIIATVSSRLRDAKGRDWGIRFWDWQTEDPPTAVISPTPPQKLKAWVGKGRFFASMMSSDGNRFFSSLGSGGRMTLDLKNPNPAPDGEPEPEEKPKDQKK